MVPVPADLGSDLDRVPAYDPYEPLKEDDDWYGVMNQLYGDANRISGLPNNDGPEPGMLGFLQDYYSTYMLSWEGLDILLGLHARPDARDQLARQELRRERPVVLLGALRRRTRTGRSHCAARRSAARATSSSPAVEQFDVTTVFNQLATAGKSWGLYFTDVWKENKSYTEFTFPWISKAAGSLEIADIPTFMKRAKEGQLPQFTYLEPKWGYGKGTEESKTSRAPTTTRRHVLRPAEEFLGDVYTRDPLQGSAVERRRSFVVTFDEHGGTLRLTVRSAHKTNQPGDHSVGHVGGFNFRPPSASGCRRSWCRPSSRRGRCSVHRRAARIPSTTRRC